MIRQAIHDLGGWRGLIWKGLATGFVMGAGLYLLALVVTVYGARPL